MNAEELPPSLNVPDGLNLGSVHGASPVTRDDAPHHFNYAAVPHSDVETSLPRLAAMLNVNRSQANNTYARIRDVQNRKFSKFSEKHGSAAADRKRPSSANRAVVKRHHHQAHQNEVDDLSPRAVPINIANRDKHAKAADPLLHSKGKRSPFNSPRSNEEDKLQALLTLTLKEYYDHHKQPPSLWTKDNDPDLPLIKQLFPINNPGMIRVVTSPTRQSPVNVPGEENLQTGSALEVETRALPELVKTMIFDDEDAQIRHEIQQMQQQQMQQQQQQGPLKPKQKLDFKLDQPLARTRKPSTARPHSASGNFDQQRVIHHNYQQQLLQQQQQQQQQYGYGHGQAHGQHPPMLEVQPANRPDPHAPLAEPIHAHGMVGNKIQPRPHSAQGYNKRPKTAERAARRQRREMDELTKMFQFADLEIRPGANVVAASAAAAGSRAPSPGGAPAPAFHAAMDTEALIPHQQGARLAPSTRQQQPQPQPQTQLQPQPQPQFPPQPTSGPRPHRRVIDLALPFSANATTINADRSHSPSPPPPMTAPALHPPTTTTTIVHHHEGASVGPAIDSRRAVQQMAYEIVIQHEKTLLQSGYDVPISVVAPERTDETAFAAGSSSSPTRFVPIWKDLLPSSLHQEMQRQLQHYKEITGQTLTTPASFQKPVVPLLEVAADIAYNRGGGGVGRTSMDGGREGAAVVAEEEEEEGGLEGISILRPDGQMKKSLQLKWKRFVGHSHVAPQHPWLMPRRRNHATAMDDDGSGGGGGGEGGGSLDEDSSYFITNEVLTSNRSRLPSTGPGESEAVVLPSLSPVGLQPSPGVFGRVVVVGGGRPTTTAPQDAMLVRLNPNIHSPRLDTPYFPIEQDQLLEHLQWRNKHIVSHSLPGRKLQRPPSANATTNAAAAAGGAAGAAGAGASGTNRVVMVPSAVPSPAPTRPLSPQDLPQQGVNPMTVLDPVQQQQLAAAAAAAAVAVAQHLATMQIPCSSQQIAAIQGAILQGEDMTQALDRILFQPPPSTVAAPGHPLPPSSSVSPVMVFPGVEHDGLPPLGTTPASPTALGGDRQVLALQQQSVRPLGSEEKLFTDTGRDAVTLWQQQIYQEQLQQQFQQQQQQQQQQRPLDPVLTGRAALPPSHDPVHQSAVSSHYPTKGNKATGRAASPESALVTERATPRDIAAGRVVPLQHVIPVGTAAVPSMDITAVQQDGSHVLQLTARTAGSSGVGVYGTNGEVPVSTTGTKGVSVLQVAAVPLLDAQARPDVRLHEQAKRYGDFINLRNIEQLQTQQQRKQHQQQIEDDEAAAAAAINAVLNNPHHTTAAAAPPSHTSNQATKSKSPRAHSLHSKLTPRTPTDSARSPHSPHSPGSPLGNRSGEAWKVPDVTPAPPPTMVFHKVPSQPPPGQSFPLLQVTGSGDAIGGGGGGGGGGGPGGPPAHMPSRRPSSSTSRRLSKPLVSPISAALGGASGLGSSGFTSPFTNMKPSGGTK